MLRTRSTILRIGHVVPEHTLYTRLQLCCLLASSLVLLSTAFSGPQDARLALPASQPQRSLTPVFPGSSVEQSAFELLDSPVA